MGKRNRELNKGRKEASRMALDQDVLDDLIGPVCHIADLRPNNEWPEELRGLVGFARRTKALFGFAVVTTKL